MGRKDALSSEKSRVGSHWPKMISPSSSLTESEIEGDLLPEKGDGWNEEVGEARSGGVDYVPGCMDDDHGL